MKIKKIFLIVFGIIFATFSILLLSLSVYLFFSKEKIKKLIITKIETTFCRKIEVNSSNIKIFPNLGISIKGIKISNTKREDFLKEPFVYIEKLDIIISLSSIFTKKPEITSLFIKKPVLLIERNQEGNFNFDDICFLKKDTMSNQHQKQEEASQFSFLLKDFNIQNGKISFYDKKNGNSIIVDDINQKMFLDIENLKNINIKGELKLSNVNLKLKNIPSPISNIIIFLSYNFKALLENNKLSSVEINNTILGINNIVFNVTGAFTDFLSNPNANVNIVTNNFDIKNIFNSIPSQLLPKGITFNEIKGKANINSQIKGNLLGSKFPITGEIKLENGYIKISSLPKPIININLSSIFTDSSLFIKGLDFIYGNSPSFISAEIINFNNPFINFFLKSNLQLNDINNFYALPDGSTIKGAINVNITSKGKIKPKNISDITQLQTNGSIIFDNVLVKTKQMLVPININGGINLNSKEIIGNTQFNFLENYSFKINFLCKEYLCFFDKNSLLTPAITFNLYSNFLDLNQLIKLDSNKTNKTPQKNNNDTLIKSLYNLPNFRLLGDINIKKFKYKNLSINNLYIKIINNKKNLYNINTKFDVFNGNIQNNLTIDLSTKEYLTFLNNLNIDKVEFNDILDFLDKEEIKPFNSLNNYFSNNIYGKTTLISSFNSKGYTSNDIVDNLNASINIILTGGKIINSPIINATKSSFSKIINLERLNQFKQFNFDNLNASIKIQNKNTIIENIKLNSDVGDWNIFGKVSFDAIIDLQTILRFNKQISNDILSAQNKIKSQVVSILNKNQTTSILTSLSNNLNIIPTDKNGNVNVKFILMGKLNNPEVKSVEFIKIDNIQSQHPQENKEKKLQNIVKETYQEKIQEKVVEKKEEIKETINKETETLKKTTVNKIRDILKK